jgi:Xaa-Pro dipeptidase
MLIREQNLIQEKLQVQMEKSGLDAMILTAPESVYYATGMASMFMYSANRVGIGLAVVPKSGKITLICSEFEAYAARNTCKDIDIITFPVWIYIADLANEGQAKPAQPDMNGTFRIAAELIRSICNNPQKVGVEWQGLPYDQMLFLRETFGAATIVDCAAELVEARAYKTPWEIAVLKNGAQAAERAMYETARHTFPGMTEEDLMLVWNKACLSQGKKFYGQFAAHTLADQYSPVVIPRDLPHLKAGDLVRLDGGPINKGYTSDLARTYAIGDQVAPERERIFTTLLKAHDTAFKLVGPGIPMCDVFKLCMDIVQKDIPGYIRGHFGHSVGCNRFTEEYPFFAAAETRPMEPGMVFCLEVPYYSSFNSSYNLEDTFVVTENGIDRFTTNNRSLFWK